MIAALPERIADVGALAMGLFLVVCGIAIAAHPERFRRGTGSLTAIRVGAVAIAILGVVIGVYLYRQPGGCETCPPWGEPSHNIIAAIWLVFLVAVTVRVLLRAFGPGDRTADPNVPR